jgi:hypothetical protein
VQLDECGDLDVIVGGSSWELLSGKVRDVRVSATKAIYKVQFPYILLSVEFAGVGESVSPNMHLTLLT